MSTIHIKNYCTAKGVNFDDHPQSKARNGKSIIITPKEHKQLIVEGVQIMEEVNASLPQSHKKFKVLENIAAEDTRCYWFKVKCTYCRELFILCPPRKTLKVNLRNHLSGFKHQKAVETAEQVPTPARMGRLGRPSRSNNMSLNSNQYDLHLWFKSNSSTGVAGMFEISNHTSVASLVCYGFRGPSMQYGGNQYLVSALLDDSHCGILWYPEPHVNAEIDV